MKRFFPAQYRNGLASWSAGITAAVLFVNVLTRDTIWMREWLYCTTHYAFYVIMIGPLLAGLAAIEARNARKYRISASQIHSSRKLITTTFSSILIPALFVYILGALLHFAALIMFHTPFFPGPATLLPVLAAIANLAMQVAVGTFLGWKLPYLLTAGATSLALFFGSISIYATKLDFLINIGGSGGASHIGLSQNTSRLLLQTVLFLLIATTLLLACRSKDPYRKLIPAPSILAIPTLLLLGYSIFNVTDPLVETTDQKAKTICQNHNLETDKEITICLVKGYEDLQEETFESLAPTLNTLEAANVPFPSVYSQVPGKENAIEIQVIGDSDPGQTILNSYFSYDCIEKSPDKQTTFMTLIYLLTSSPELHESIKYDPSVPEKVSKGTETDHLEWIKEAFIELQDCRH